MSENEWIATKNQMPPSGQDVLVSTYDRTLAIGRWNEERDYWILAETLMGRTRFGKRLVLAWMHLPKFYEEEQ